MTFLLLLAVLFLHVSSLQVLLSRLLRHSSLLPAHPMLGNLNDLEKVVRDPWQMSRLEEYCENLDEIRRDQLEKLFLQHVREFCKGIPFPHLIAPIQIIQETCFHKPSLWDYLPDEIQDCEILQYLSMDDLLKLSKTDFSILDKLNQATFGKLLRFSLRGQVQDLSREVQQLCVTKCKNLPEKEIIVELIQSVHSPHHWKIASKIAVECFERDAELIPFLVHEIGDQFGYADPSDLMHASSYVVSFLKQLCILPSIPVTLSRGLTRLKAFDALRFFSSLQMPFDNYPPLCYALLFGLDTFQEAISAGLFWNSTNGHRESAVHCISVCIISRELGELTQALDQLLKIGANIDDRSDDGYTLLILVSSSSSRKAPQLLQRILEVGADVNSRTDNGFDALCFAARDGRVENINVLIENGANVIGRVGASPLHIAVVFHHLEAVERLLQSPDIDVNGRDSYGTTPLHIASSLPGNFQLFHLLVHDERVDLNLKDQLGETALHKALSLESALYVRILLENGADRSLVESDTVKNAIHECQDLAKCAEIQELFYSNNPISTIQQHV